MNWSRVRWLLIVCLCLADLVLGVLLWRDYRGENTVSHAAIEDAAALLAEVNVTLPPEVVPTAVIRDYVYRVPVSEDAYRAAFSAMTGAEVSGVYLLPGSSGMSLLFENGDRAEYYHNLYLTYTRGDGDSAVYASVVEAYTEAPGTTGYAEAGGKAASAAAEAAQLFLSALTSGGTEAVSLRPRLQTVRVTPQEGVYLVVFCEEIVYRGSRRSAADLYDTVIYALTEGETVLYLSGTWVPFLPDEVYSIRKLDQLNILFSERTRHQTNGISGDAAQAFVSDHTAAGCTMTSMQRLYYMLWDDAGTLYLRPAWLMGYDIPQEDGDTIRRKILCDGVTGNVVRQD